MFRLRIAKIYHVLCVFTMNMKLRAGGRGTHDRNIIRYAVIFAALPGIQPAIKLWKSDTWKRNHYWHREITVDIDWLAKIVNIFSLCKVSCSRFGMKYSMPRNTRLCGMAANFFSVSSITTKLTSRTYGNQGGDWTNTKKSSVDEVCLLCAFTYLVKAPEMTA